MDDELHLQLAELQIGKDAEGRAHAAAKRIIDAAAATAGDDESEAAVLRAALELWTQAGARIEAQLHAAIDRSRGVVFSNAHTMQLICQYLCFSKDDTPPLRAVCSATLSAVDAIAEQAAVAAIGESVVHMVSAPRSALILRTAPPRRATPRRNHCGWALVVGTPMALLTFACPDRDRPPPHSTARHVVLVQARHGVSTHVLSRRRAGAGWESGRRV